MLYSPRERERLSESSSKQVQHDKCSRVVVHIVQSVSKRPIKASFDLKLTRSQAIVNGYLTP